MKIIGFHLDLKAQMPNFPFICRIIERIADMGYNTVLLEYQDKFPYFGELSPLASPDALTVAQIEEIKRLCRKNSIEIIPMMQCLGHMYWVTRFDRYASLGEHYAEKGKGSHSLCASKKESLELFGKLASQVMSLHGDSKYFHIGADEIKFSETCSECRGKSQAMILADYYGKALGFVKDKGYTPVMWGDMVLKYDGLADMLPKDTVVMDWDYTGILSEENGREFYGRAYPLSEDSHVAFSGTDELLSKGFEVICAPAVRSMVDTVLMPRNAHLDNCIQAVQTAKKSGSLGVIVTSWAVRRVPHILTEPILEAVARLCKGESLCYDAVLQFISEKYFGESDAEIGRIPFEFARLLADVQSAANLLSSGQDFMDADSGMFLSDSIEKRLLGAEIYKNEKIKESCSALEKGCLALLEDIKNPDFCEYSRMLARALEAGAALGGLISGLCDGAEDEKELTALYGKTDILRVFPDALSEYYTEFSMPTEYMARFDVYKDYIKMLLSERGCAQTERSTGSTK